MPRRGLHKERAHAANLAVMTRRHDWPTQTVTSHSRSSQHGDSGDDRLSSDVSCEQRRRLASDPSEQRPRGVKGKKTRETRTRSC
jgi:hypothetical protein